MRIVWLLRYICGAWLLLALLASAITYAPDIDYLGLLLPIVFMSMALLAAGAEIGLGRLPPTHRIHQSKLLWAGLLALAVAATLLVIAVV